MSNLRRASREVHEDEGWLITFADMCVLLMCFFVLLFALSKPDDGQVQAIAKGLRDAGFRDPNSAPTEDPLEKMKKIALSLGASGYDKFIATKETPQGIDIELSSGAFFVPGAATFTVDAVPMLEMVAAQIGPLAKADIVIEVEGHTDDSPVHSQLYPSNWELSAARAASMVRYLASSKTPFPQDKMKVIGRGATVPKAPNRDAAGNVIPANQDLNRRVIIHMVRGDDH